MEWIHSVQNPCRSDIFVFKMYLGVTWCILVSAKCVLGLSVEGRVYSCSVLWSIMSFDQLCLCFQHTPSSCRAVFHRLAISCFTTSNTKVLHTACWGTSSKCLCVSSSQSRLRLLAHHRAVRVCWYIAEPLAFVCALQSRWRLLAHHRAVLASWD